MLDLERLAQFSAQDNRFFARNLDSLEGLVFLDDPGHFGLDLRKILLRDRMFHQEVVVEPVVDRRPESQLDALEQPHHRPGHHVGARVTHHVERFGVLVGQQPEGDLTVVGQTRIGPHHPSINHRGKSRLRQPRPDVGGNIHGANVARIFLNRSVGQIDFEHVLHITLADHPPPEGPSIQRTAKKLRSEDPMCII